MAGAKPNIGYHFSEKELIREIKVDNIYLWAYEVARSLQASAIDMGLGVQCSRPKAKIYLLGKLLLYNVQQYPRYENWKNCKI